MKIRKIEQNNPVAVIETIQNPFTKNEEKICRGFFCCVTSADYYRKLFGNNRVLDAYLTNAKFVKNILLSKTGKTYKTDEVFGYIRG